MLAISRDTLESTLRALVEWAKTRGTVVLAIALRGAVQLLFSLLFSLFLYRALYHASRLHPAHRRCN